MLIIDRVWEVDSTAAVPPLNASTQKIPVWKHGQRVVFSPSWLGERQHRMIGMTLTHLLVY